MIHGFFRAACASPAVTLADCNRNAAAIIEQIHTAAACGASLVVFPELCITGYTCGDLFLQQPLQSAAVAALESIAGKTCGDPVLTTVGLPVISGNSIYNCAAFLYQGKILALVPKTYIPNYGEFYEQRYFAPAPEGCGNTVYLSPRNPAVPFGTDILLYNSSIPDLCIAAEICEDVWAPQPPSVRHALAGATVIVNLSASNEVIGKAEYRRMLTASQSARLMCCYLYADAGRGESTTDMVFAAHNIIAENGTVLAESPLFSSFTGTIIYADIDLDTLIQERRRTGTFARCAEQFFRSSDLSTAPGNSGEYRRIPIDFDTDGILRVTGLTETPGSCVSGTDVRNHKQSAEYIRDTTVAAGTTSTVTGTTTADTKDSSAADTIRHEKILRYRNIAPYPFVPAETNARALRCRSVIELQAEGLVQRLRHTGVHSAVIGLSGGLDSTLALLVTVEAFRRCGLATSGIQAVTMPCFGTTGRTRNNAEKLAEQLHISFQEIPIQAAVRQHFADIGQSEQTHDVTYENSQARERTQVLMDLANRTGALVIGTGDLSELALGWATYNGDHMSMYGVNASIPKTLVRHLVSWVAQESEPTQPALSAVLNDILDTPVSPELLPPESGSISQKTEELVGPYDLHDFFLYYVLRRGFGPEKIFFLAREAFCSPEHRKQYPPETILRWLNIFFRRFFAQQFKRSCLPDGAKVGTVSLSPRGDWRMPSDASRAVWQAELDRLETQLQKQGIPGKDIRYR